MKYIIACIVLLFTVPVFAKECSRNFQAYIVEKGKGKLPNHMNILLEKEHLYIGNYQLPNGNYVFTYPIRYDEGKMYTGNKRPLNTFYLHLTDGVFDEEILAVSVTDENRITITDYERIVIVDGIETKEIAPEFFNLNFDKNGDIFLLGLNIKILPDCKIKASAELKTATYTIDSNSLKVNDDNSYFRMIGSVTEL